MISWGICVFCIFVQNRSKKEWKSSSLYACWEGERQRERKYHYYCLALCQSLTSHHFLSDLLTMRRKLKLGETHFQKSQRSCRVKIIAHLQLILLYPMLVECSWKCTRWSGDSPVFTQCFRSIIHFSYLEVSIAVQKVYRKLGQFAFCVWTPS